MTIFWIPPKPFVRHPHAFFVLQALHELVRSFILVCASSVAIDSTEKCSIKPTNRYIVSLMYPRQSMIGQCENQPLRTQTYRVSRCRRYHRRRGLWYFHRWRCINSCLSREGCNRWLCCHRWFRVGWPCHPWRGCQCLVRTSLNGDGN